MTAAQVSPEHSTVSSDAPWPATVFAKAASVSALASSRWLRHRTTPAIAAAATMTATIRVISVVVCRAMNPGSGLSSSVPKVPSLVEAGAAVSAGAGVNVSGVDGATGVGSVGLVPGVLIGACLFCVSGVWGCRATCGCSKARSTVPQLPVPLPQVRSEVRGALPRAQLGQAGEVAGTEVEDAR